MTVGQTQTLEIDVSRSMDAEPLLYPFLPYLMQDIHELGVRTKDIMGLFAQLPKSAIEKVLDLGCGKSPTLPKLVHTYQCSGQGIDAVPAFIEEAKRMCDQESLSDNLSYAVHDIHQWIQQPNDFGVVMYFAMGELLGSVGDTLTRLRHLIREEGIICFDEAYVPSESIDQSEGQLDVYSRQSVIDEIETAGFYVVAEQAVDSNEECRWYKESTAHILRRARELSVREDPGPAKRIMQYAQRQVDEAELLEGDIQSALWAVRARQ